MPGLIESRRGGKPPMRISILEKSESEVSGCWKSCQLFAYVLVVISGIATAMGMGNIVKGFQSDCLLYANMNVTEVNWTTREVTIRKSADTWGASSNCSFAQFSPVASVIFGAIWATLFVMCGRGGDPSRNLPQPWRIVPPALVFNFVFLIISSVNVAVTFGGFSEFCASVSTKLNLTRCEELTEFTWTDFPEASNFYDDVIIVETGATIGLIGWVAGFMILFVRCVTHADFKIVAHPISPTGSGRTTRTEVHSSGPSSPKKPEVEPLISVESNLPQPHHSLHKQPIGII